VTREGTRSQVLGKLGFSWYAGPQGSPFAGIVDGVICDAEVIAATDDSGATIEG